ELLLRRVDPPWRVLDLPGALIGPVGEHHISRHSEPPSVSWFGWSPRLRHCVAPPARYSVTMMTNRPGCGNMVHNLLKSLATTWRSPHSRQWSDACRITDGRDPLTTRSASLG